MKKILNSLVVPVVIAVLLGFIGGKYIFKTYKDNLYEELSSSRLYLAIGGEYETVDLMREDNSSNNYIYYKDNDKYKTVVGITRKYDNIGKIKQLYNNELMVEEYYITRDKYDVRQDEYDKELENINDITEVKEVVDNILNLYRSDDKIKLIAID